MICNTLSDHILPYDKLHCLARAKIILYFLIYFHIFIKLISYIVCGRGFKVLYLQNCFKFFSLVFLFFYIQVKIIDFLIIGENACKIIKLIKSIEQLYSLLKELKK